MIAVADILARVETLPTLPTSVARLASLLGDERAGAADFEAVIRPDPALTANLLRLANSAAFGCRREIASVGQAVALLGLKRVFEAAAGAAFARVLPPSLPGYGVNAAAFWRHSIAVAVIAERLAIEVEGRAPGLCFTAGLLHDIGKLAISSFLLEESARLKARLGEGPVPFVSVEQELLGTDHAALGQTMLERWHLPAPLAEAAGRHHQPAVAAEAPAEPLVDLVHAADCLAHALGFGADVGELRREVAPAVGQRLGLRHARLEKVASEVLEPIGELERLLQPEAGRAG